jgi:hypothetical protein
VDNDKKVSDDAMARLLTQRLFVERAPRYTDDPTLQLLARGFADFANLRDPIDLIRGFVQAVFAGETPPPAMLVAIAEHFNSYLYAKGDVSLDEAFGQKIKQGKKNQLKQRLNNEKYGRVYYYMWQLRRGKGYKIAAAALAAKAHYQLRISAYSIETMYKSSKSEKSFDGMHDTIKNYSVEKLKK